MKKYLLKISIFALLLLGIIVSVSVIIDPYNVFHYEYPVDNGVEANKNFIKTKYLLKHSDEFDSLVFGSSRAGFVDVASLPDGKYYNMSSSEAVPAEHLNTLKVLIKNDFVPENVLILMDDISCFVDPALHEEMLYRVPYPTGGFLSHLEFYRKYCDVITNLEALQVILNYQEEDSAYTRRFRESGMERTDIVVNFDGTGHGGFWAEYYSLRLEECMGEIRELIELCEEYDINLRIATNPLYYKTYANSAENGYLDFLEALSELTDFYNFSSFSEITTNDANYYEPSHFNVETTKLMMDVMYQDWHNEELLAQGFGVKVTKENKDEFLAFLRQQASEYGVDIP